MEVINRKTNYDYLDVLKGILMIWVVLAHVIHFVINNYHSIIVDSGSLIRMPLFFLFSGFLSYSSIYSQEVFSKRVRNRLYRQLWPTVCIFIVYTVWSYGFNPKWGGEVAYSKVLISAILDHYKDGYWFTIVLVEIFMVFALCSRLIYQARLPDASHIVLLIIFCVLRVLLNMILSLIPPSLSDALSLNFVLRYLPFFYIGVIWRIYSNNIEKYIPGKSGYGALLLSGVVISCGFVSDNDLWRLVLVCVSIFAICSLRNSFTGGHKIPQMLKYVGKRTLPVYLLHYFFLYSLSWLNIDLASRFDPIVGNIVAVMISLCIVYLCIAVDNIMKKHIPSAHKFIFSPSELRLGQSLKATSAE